MVFEGLFQVFSGLELIKKGVFCPKRLRDRFKRAVRMQRFLEVTLKAKIKKNVHKKALFLCLPSSGIAPCAGTTGTVHDAYP